MKNFPSIFNDVIGPIMRGPSSSHTAASWRIARLSLEILNEPLKSAVIDFDREGAWATNFREQGTVIGISGGLLGLDITDDRMKNVDPLTSELGIRISYEINSFETQHVNTVRLSLSGSSNKKVQVLAASLGGGSFEIQQINGCPVKLIGSHYEVLLFRKNNKAVPDEITSLINSDNNLIPPINWEDEIINIKSSEIIRQGIIDVIQKSDIFEEIVMLNPILPIIPKSNPSNCFSNIDSLLNYAEEEKLDLGGLGLLYEKSLSHLSSAEIKGKMEELVQITLNSIENGLKGTVYKDRILHHQSYLIEKSEQENKVFQNSLINNTVKNISAIMESKSAMEVIIANPTAGSCGTVGGVLKAAADELNKSREELIDAFFAAGMIGVYFALGPGFSAEEHGCQVECGAASGMAAAGIVQLFGGTASQAVSAASMAIQNMIGLVCDPVGDRVEVPCLGKNISAAMNAISSATMAASGYDVVIPLEEVLETVQQVSKHMPPCVKCTGNGGLAITPTSLNIKSILLNSASD